MSRHVTNMNINLKTGDIAAMEEAIEYYKAQIDYCEALLMTGELNTVDTMTVEKKLDKYRWCFNTVCRELRERKAKLRGMYNIDAFGYDSRYAMDDSYYERKFRQDGYLVGYKY